MMLLVTANTMAQSIRERTSELAVLKTLGFGDGRVLSMVLMESCVLALVGGLAGLGARLVPGDGSAIRPDAFLPAFYLPARDLIVGRRHGHRSWDSPPARCRPGRPDGCASSTP